MFQSRAREITTQARWLSIVANRNDKALSDVTQMPWGDLRADLALILVNLAKDEARELGRQDGTFSENLKRRSTLAKYKKSADYYEQVVYALVKKSRKP